MKISMAHIRLAFIVIGVVLISLAAPVMAAPLAPAVATSAVAAASVCNGKYKGGLRPSQAELAEILKKHAAWLKEGGDRPDSRLAANDPRIANLCGAGLLNANLGETSLQGAHLEGAVLSFADLRGAHLFGTHLDGAQLYGAHLEGADLENAHLDNADLTGAHLEGADLFSAHLDGAQLFSAHLDGADLHDAHLDGAHLSATHLDGANFYNAHLNGADLATAHVSKAKLAGVDLTGATYAPASQPPDPYVVGIKGLATLHAGYGEEIGLIQLRKLLKDGGLNDSVREATCSIQRNITRDQLWRDSSRSAHIEGWLRTVGLDWTTAYGLHPERALRWILLLGAVLTPVYTFAILRPTASSGVMQVFPADRLEGTAGDPADEEKRKKQLVHAKGWRAALRTAAYFSLISAVNIGFEDFTPGDWIRRLQTREYSLEAVGWVRVVAGAQALLSVYLLAMWVLTQFGQPFE